MKKVKVLYRYKGENIVTTREFDEVKYVLVKDSGELEVTDKSGMTHVVFNSHVWLWYEFSS